jgi:hypothetical protein
VSDPEGSIIYQQYNDGYASWKSVAESFGAIFKSFASSFGDVLGFGFNASFDDEAVGGAGSVSLMYITNGQFSGFYVAFSGGVVLGTENGIGNSVFSGKYLGYGDPNPMSILGSYININPGGPGGVYWWASYATAPGVDMTWSGSGLSDGTMGIGIQAGNTYPIYGFPNNN